MIRSMTGFGKADEKSPYGQITAEIKTLNHKSLSISCTPLNGFFLLEEKLKKIFEKKVFRGKVFIKITRESIPGEKSLQNVEVNGAVAKEYLKKIRKVQKDLGVSGDIKINDLIGFAGVVECSASKSEDKLWPYVRRTIDQALDELVRYREGEGARVAKDFKMRLQKISKRIREIRKYEKQSVGEYRDRLNSSIKHISSEVALDKGRLEAEVALFAKNCDVTEELTRLKGHVAIYKETLDSKGVDVGKKLDFIAQEMQREVNTIGAKSSNFQISECVIDLKSEIEKMREQIRNIE